MRLPTFLAVLVAIGFPSAALAADEPAQADYSPMPWHLVDLWWDLGKEAEFDSYSVDVTLSADVPDDVSLYVAPIGLGHLNAIDFYGGLQTRCDGSTKRDPVLRQLGRGLIFSMWGERSLDAIRPAEGGFCQSSGHEGDFVSVRRPYHWTRGTYTYRLVRMDREQVNGTPYTWVGVLVHSQERDENIFAGALRFKGEKLMLGHSVASFVEVYGRQRPVADIPHLTVTFAHLKVNGQPAHIVSAQAVYPLGVPDRADAKAVEEGIEITVGDPVPDRRERTVPLIGK